MINAEQLNAIKERAAKATPGPWKFGATGLLHSVETHEQLLRTQIPGGIVARWVDTQFIAHSREDIPALVAEVERLNTVKHRLNSDVELYRKQYEGTQIQLSESEAENAQLREALTRITKHRVNHFPTCYRMVESIFNTAKEALEINL